MNTKDLAQYYVLSMLYTATYGTIGLIEEGLAIEAPEGMYNT